MLNDGKRSGEGKQYAIGSKQLEIQKCTKKVRRKKKEAGSFKKCKILNAQCLIVKQNLHSASWII